MPNYSKPGATGIDLGFGAAAGAISQVLANNDAKRIQEFGAVAANAGKAYPFYKKANLLLSFGLPAVAVVTKLVDAIPVPEEWSDRMLIAGGVLAGQQATQMITKKHYKLVYSLAEFAASPRYNGYTPRPRPSEYNVTNSNEVMV
jgi:hypothetical protein